MASPSTEIRIGPSFLRLPAVQARTGLSRSGIYQLVRRGEFPLPIKLGRRASAWLESEVSAWIEARIEMARPKRATLRELQDAT